jgi:hypothetical protein
MLPSRTPIGPVLICVLTWAGTLQAQGAPQQPVRRVARETSAAPAQSGGGATSHPGGTWRSPRK